MAWMEDLGLPPEGLAALPAAARREVAAFLIRWGYYADALPILRCLEEEAPDIPVSAWMVEALVGTGAVQDALRLADALAAGSPDRPEVAAARADALLAAGRHDDALASARSLVEGAGSARVLGLERLARCRLAAGDLAPALAAAEQCLALAPPDAIPASALRLLSQALLRDPASTARLREVRCQMGAAYETDLQSVRQALAQGAAAPPVVPAPEDGAAGASPSGAEQAADAGGRGSRRAVPVGAPLPGDAVVCEPPHQPQAAGAPDVERALRELFGHEGFRPGQREVIDAVLQGQDVLAVFPTGGGKSLCYQLPAALLPGATVVISPLIALMKDQLEGLPPGLAERATVVHSALELGEVDERLRGIAEGRYQLVYAAPERLRQWAFLDALRRARISLFVIDEAHCLSLWGHDFRPDYLFLGPTLRRLGTPPVLAMTATATPVVQAEIGRRLGRELRRVSLGVFRPNLRLEVVGASNDEEKLGLLIDLCRSERGAVIVYANARERCEDLARMLRGRGVQAIHYHAGLEREERASVQDSFMSGEIRIVVATVAFGMGVDKADVRMVVHYNLPRSLESYYQEAGRAGRDGQPSRCVLLATPGDRGNLTRWMAQERIPIKLLGDTYRAVRQAAGASRAARVSTEDLARAIGCDDETRLRVALSLLEQVGLLRRHMDLPRSMTLRLRRRPEDPAIEAILAAAQLRPGRSVTLDPLELAAAANVPPGELEGLLLAGQARGWLTCWGSGRDPLLEVPDPPAEARAELERLVAAHEEQQRSRLQHMVDYVKTRSCRHRAIAQHFGERAPHCPGCDNCAADRRGTRVVRDAETRPAPSRRKQPDPKTSEAGLTILQCIAGLPFAVGKKGLCNILRGSLAAPIRKERCPQHGALSDVSKAAIERLADSLLEEGYLERGGDAQRPTLSLTRKGVQTLESGSLE